LANIEKVFIVAGSKLPDDVLVVPLIDRKVLATT
jgi:hypothetical protein